jgi:hypothetical protein
MNDQIQNVRPQHFVRPEDAGVSTLSNAAQYLAKEIGTIVGKESLKVIGKEVGKQKGQDAGMLFIQPPEPGGTEPSKINPLVFALAASALSYSTNKQTEEGQTSVLNVQNASYSEQCKQQIADIQNSIDEASKSSKAGTWGDVFGWVATIAIDVVAIAATVLTGGAALPLLIGAMIATTLKVGSEFGSPLLTDLTNVVAKGLEDLGMSDQAAQVVAGIVVAVAVVVVSIVACAGAGAATESLVSLGEKGIKKLTGTAVKLSWNLVSDASSVTGKVAFGMKSAAGIAMGAATVGEGAASTTASVYDYQSAMAQVAAKGKQAVMDALQQLMNQEIDNLGAIFAMEAELVSGLAANISSLSETGSTLARNI